MAFTDDLNREVADIRRQLAEGGFLPALRCVVTLLLSHKEDKPVIADMWSILEPAVLMRCLQAAVAENDVDTVKSLQSIAPKPTLDFCNCTLAALAANALRGRLIADVNVDDLFPVLEAAARAVGYKCDVDAGMGALLLALAAPRLLSRSRGSALVTPTWAADIAFTALAGLVPRESRSQVSWCWDVTRELLEKPRITTRQVKVTIAGTEARGTGKQQGFLATLYLDIQQPGCGQVFHYPLHICETRADNEFISSMTNAWDAACSLVREMLNRAEETAKAAMKIVDPRTSDGRWHLLRGEEPAKDAQGRSASGAAFRGWATALKGEVLDDRVIVLAQIVAQNDGVWDLGEVDGVKAKTRAIVEQGKGCLDTIVVVDEGNETQANGVLKTMRATGRIDVKRI